MEEDDELQDMWAKLLVNALDADSGVEVQRSFVSILKDLTPLEALILSKLCKAVVKHGRIKAFYTADLPQRAHVEREKVKNKKSLRKDVQIALWDLARLGCIRSEDMFGGPDAVGLVSVTTLGMALVSACTLKRKE